MRFLSRHHIAEAINSSLEKASFSNIAVAYWGGGATSSLRFPADLPVRIVCDAWSGACNPDTLSSLIRMNHVQLKTLDRMHAKVYVTDGSLIVGSANASANGLGEEDREVGNLEAAIQTQDSVAISQAASWFESLWSSARPLDETDIERIRPFWSARRGGRPVRGAKTLIDAIRDTPWELKDRRIRVLAYPLGGVHESVSNYFDDKSPDLKVGSDKLTYYQAGYKWDVQVGDIFVDYYYPENNRRRLYTSGLLKAILISNVSSDYRIVFLERINTAYGFTFSPENKALLMKAINAFVKAENPDVDEDGNLIEFQVSDLYKVLGEYIPKMGL